MKKICEYEKCKKEFETDDEKKRFCNRSCSASHNNTGVRRHGKGKTPCLSCGAMVKGKYCDNNKCQWEHQYAEFIKGWLSGKITGVIGSRIEQVSTRIYRWIIDNRGEKCEKCGWHERNLYNNTIPLQLHHKDGDSRNCRPENLELICPNCHSLTKNFGNLNKGHGRKKRYAGIA